MLWCAQQNVASTQRVHKHELLMGGHMIVPFDPGSASSFIFVSALFHIQHQRT